ncbi:type I DNA topoisomerase [Sediminibacterium soli]|uniref:type I DNA topoisomerase n=1 Tax=Sediminibacterium soli TaxID=2698829 RepID=UPI00137B487D|nr:type I DNA topoisomerase [Sediminibacterium soli]NCI47085.1 type I DNA topoisomerase [Sediminibacterium soli]
MAKNLLIVESPAKAKTIEKILGKDFEVRSSYGHIRDLEKDDMGIDLNNQYQPRYKVPEDKERVVRELKQMAKKAQEVWLASDEDREGESISWHLAEVLGLDPQKTKRIVFHEITAPAIRKAVETPRRINMDLVNAQQARRVLDRLVGFELSPVLWRKIGMQRSLSAGRVQSVAVRLIVEREREINNFIAESSYKIDAFFTAPDSNGKQVGFKAEGPARMSALTDAQAFLESCRNAVYTISDVQVKPTKRTPAAPFTTSTLQQEASRKMGYSVSRTMLLAQKLYESGKITYMRTDSVNLSDTAMGDIQKQVNKAYGEEYYQPRKYKNKNENAQEAHEAIRPTYMSNTTVEDPDAKKLYELIWKRTIASQMSDAEFEKTTAKIDISTNREHVTATGEVMKFEGFLKAYREGRDDEDEDNNEDILPPLAVGQELGFKEMTATEKFSRPAPRYTEASLVKKLEELGIGRPSTYAPTISTIIKRNYVEKRDKDGVKREVNLLRLSKDQKLHKEIFQENTGAEKSKLFPTDLGLVVTDFLKQYFERVMDFSFTARIEEEFDEIAEGKLKWNTMIDGFYKPFHETIEHTLENAERAKGERELGMDPESGKRVIARMGRYGPMVQIGDTANEEEKPRFAKLNPSQSIETISLEEAMQLFALPRTLGEYEGQEVAVNVGRFGPYVKFGEQFISIPRGEDLHEMELDRAVELITEKQQADAPIAMYQNLPVTKGKGRFGPFIKWNDMFINIPRAYNFDALSESDINELIEKKISKEANRFIRQWPEEKISVENGRWGAFIRFNKKMLKLGRKADNAKYTAEELAEIDLEEIKKMIEEQVPNAFARKLKTAAKKSAAPKKTAAKKTAAAKSKPKSQKSKKA